MTSILCPKNYLLGQRNGLFRKENAMEFNEKLQKLRKQKGLTQEELAEVLFVSRTAISKWESDKEFVENYPNWYFLTGEEQNIVSKIASQTILTCEDIAAIYVKFANVRKTVEYLKDWYGYEVKI